MDSLNRNAFWALGADSPRRARKNSQFVCSMSAALVVSLWPIAATADAVEYNTAQYWTPTAGILAGLGPGQSSTTGETFVAPQGGHVTLDDFSFFAQSYYGGTGYGGG